MMASLLTFSTAATRMTRLVSTRLVFMAKAIHRRHPKLIRMTAKRWEGTNKFPNMLTDLRIYLSQVDIPQAPYPIDLWNDRALLDLSRPTTS